MPKITINVEDGEPKREENGTLTLLQNLDAKPEAIDPKLKFDLLKMEYEKAAERYENIYRAMWQNFSYLSLLSAAILTFGSSQLALWATVFLSGLPLVFWFLVQFLPLDAYGRDTRMRLRDIEYILNQNYFGEVPSKPPIVEKIPWIRMAEGFREALRKFLSHLRTGAIVDRLRGKIPPQSIDLKIALGHFTEFSGTARSECLPRYSIRTGIVASALVLGCLWFLATTSLPNAFDWKHFVRDSTASNYHIEGFLPRTPTPTPTPTPIPALKSTPISTPVLSQSASPAATPKSH